MNLASRTYRPRGRESAATVLVAVGSDEPLDRAAQRMAETGVSRLAVLDRSSGRPAGVLSTLDIVRLLARDAQAQAEA